MHWSRLHMNDSCSPCSLLPIYVTEYKHPHRLRRRPGLPTACRLEVYVVAWMQLTWGFWLYSVVQIWIKRLLKLQTLLFKLFHYPKEVIKKKRIAKSLPVNRHAVEAEIQHGLYQRPCSTTVDTIKRFSSGLICWSVMQIFHIYTIASSWYQTFVIWKCSNSLKLYTTKYCTGRHTLNCIWHNSNIELSWSWNISIQTDWNRWVDT